MYGRADNGEKQEVLESGLKVKVEAMAAAEPGNDAFDHIPASFGSLLSLGVRLIRPGGITSGREETGTRVKMFVMEEPEPVHEVIVRAKRRTGSCRTADKSSKNRVGAEAPNPGGEAGGRGPAIIKEKECKRADDLSLIGGRASGMGIERFEKKEDVIKVKEREFLSKGSKFGMEPDSLRGIERNFSLMQERKIILMGLPVK